jgi:hypothetical protein
LNTTTTYLDEDELVSAGAQVILSESPGEVYSYSTNTHTINIEPMHVYSREDSEIYTLIRAMSVSRNLLKDNFKILNFEVKDIADLKGAKILFLIKESKGPVSIYLNDKLIFEGVMTSSQLPLELPLIHLQEKNKLEFYSDSPGIRIFSSNYYLLQDIKLVKTFKREKTTASRTFYVSEEIGDRINRASLDYFITCNQIEERPTLTIMLNNRQVFKDTIFCEYLEERTLPLTKTSLNVYGQNRLVMQVDKGDINIDEISVKADLTKSMFPTYTFDVSSELWTRLDNGDTNLYLKMKLKEGDRKRAKLYVQGDQFTMDTTSSIYSKDITNMVDNGANVLKIVPDNNFEIFNLKIVGE